MHLYHWECSFISSLMISCNVLIWGRVIHQALNYCIFLSYSTVHFSFLFNSGLTPFHPSLQLFPTSCLCNASSVYCSSVCVQTEENKMEESLEWGYSIFLIIANEVTCQWPRIVGLVNKACPQEVLGLLFFPCLMVTLHVIIVIPAFSYASRYSYTWLA